MTIIRKPVFSLLLVVLKPESFLFLLLKGLVEVVTSSDDQLAVRATILLGELLHMVIARYFEKLQSII